MKYNFSIFLFSIFLFSCTQNIKDNNICKNDIESLFAKYDSNKFEIRKFENLIELLDRPNPTGERGIYKFDDKNNLRFYGYLVNEKNDYFFSVEYDSLGNEIYKSQPNVVRWFVAKTTADSLRVSFLLYANNYTYRDIFIDYLSSKKSIPLFKSKYFSNLIAGDLDIKKSNSGKIYISGFKKSKCSNKEIPFSDSTIIPKVE